MKMKNKMLIVGVACLMIVINGFLVVSNGLPSYIKEASALKVNYSFMPFDVRLETNKYRINMNLHSIEKCQKSLAGACDSAKDGISFTANKFKSSVTNCFNRTVK